MASILERNKNVKPKKKTREEYAEDALYREVWEEVNNEKTMHFIRKYSRVLLSVALGIMILVVGVQIGVRMHRNAKIATAMNYEAAIENVDVNALSALGKNARGATADLAAFQAYLVKGDKQMLEHLAANAKTRDFRDLAKIHLAMINGDAMTGAEMEKYLADLNSKSSPYYFTGRLVVAQRYLADGDVASANKWLDKIIGDKDAPSVVAATAQTLR